MYELMTTEFKQIHSEMQSMGSGPASLPVFGTSFAVERPQVVIGAVYLMMAMNGVEMTCFPL